MNYLLVIAHSDDEIIGCGASIQKWVADGHNVDILCLANGYYTREDGLLNTMKQTSDQLEIRNLRFCDCIALQFNEHKRYPLVRQIEESIIEWETDVIVTHSSTGLHLDHCVTNSLVIEAMRLPQRTPNAYKPLIKVMEFEQITSDSWSVKPFQPNFFVEVTQQQIRKKIQLIDMYDNVIREAPHPRCKDNIEGLARYRGCQSGCEYAEAYRVVYELERRK